MTMKRLVATEVSKTSYENAKKRFQELIDTVKEDIEDMEIEYKHKIDDFAEYIKAAERGNRYESIANDMSGEVEYHVEDFSDTINTAQLHLSRAEQRFRSVVEEYCKVLAEQTKYNIENNVEQPYK